MQKVRPSDFSKDLSRLSLGNIALCTISNDAFAVGTKVLLHSFLDHNPWFSGDLIVFTNARAASLSLQNKKDLQSISNKVTFYEIDYSRYSKVYDRFSKIFLGKPQMRFLPSFFTYEAFELTSKYDRVLYLDSDMLVISDISDVFLIDSKVPVVTPDAGEFSLDRSFVNFNGGFIYLTSNVERGIRDQLLEYSLLANDHALADQSIMNAFFKGNVLALDSRYNCLKRCFPDSKYSKFDSSIKVIHYVGAKPWHANKKGRELEYRQLENLWHLELKKIHANGRK